MSNLNQLVGLTSVGEIVETIARPSVGGIFRKTSVGGNFGRLSAEKKKEEERGQEFVVRTSVGRNLAKSSVGGNVGRLSAGKKNRKIVDRRLS